MSHCKAQRMPHRLRHSLPHSLGEHGVAVEGLPLGEGLPDAADGVGLSSLAVHKHLQANTADKGIG